MPWFDHVPNLNSSILLAHKSSAPWQICRWAVLTSDPFGHSFMGGEGLRGWTDRVGRRGSQGRVVGLLVGSAAILATEYGVAPVWKLVKDMLPRRRVA